MVLTARDRSGLTISCNPATHTALQFTVAAAAGGRRGFLGVSKIQPLALVETMCSLSHNGSGSGCGFHAVGANLLYFHTPTRKQPTDRLATYYAFLQNLTDHGAQPTVEQHEHLF